MTNEGFPIAMYNPGISINYEEMTGYYHGEGFGSTTFLTSTDEDILASAEFGEFGIILNSEGWWMNDDMWFSGMEYEKNSELYTSMDNGIYYDPNISDFINQLDFNNNNPLIFNFKPIGVCGFAQMQKDQDANIYAPFMTTEEYKAEIESFKEWRKHPNQKWLDDPYTSIEDQLSENDRKFLSGVWRSWMAGWKIGNITFSDFLKKYYGWYIKLGDMSVPPQYTDKHKDIMDVYFEWNKNYEAKGWDNSFDAFIAWFEFVKNANKRKRISIPLKPQSPNSPSSPAPITIYNNKCMAICSVSVKLSRNLLCGAICSPIAPTGVGFILCVYGCQAVVYGVQGMARCTDKELCEKICK